MKRRHFLKGVAGASLAAPFLSSLAPRAARAADTATGPQRLVIFYTNNGCITNRWFPSVENGPIDAAALTGKTLAPLSDLAHKLLFPRGLAMFPRGTDQRLLRSARSGHGLEAHRRAHRSGRQPLGDRAFAGPHGGGDGEPGLDP